MKNVNIALLELTVIDMPSPSFLFLWSFTRRGSPIPRFFLPMLAGSSFSVISGFGGDAIFLSSVPSPTWRPRHARMTVLWRWRWISDSIWLHSMLCSSPFKLRPSNWICWILSKVIWEQKQLQHTVKQVKAKRNHELEFQISSLNISLFFIDSSKMLTVYIQCHLNVKRIFYLPANSLSKYFAANRAP